LIKPTFCIVYSGDIGKNKKEDQAKKSLLFLHRYISISMSDSVAFLLYCFNTKLLQRRIKCSKNTSVEVIGPAFSDIILFYTEMHVDL